MPTIAEIEAEIVDDFELFDDWMERYAYIIEIGKNMPDLDDQYKSEPYRVHGCQSMVWLHATSANGTVQFEADSDAFITKGLIGLLIKVLSGQPARDIQQAELAFIDQIGIRQHLSTNRSNGLSAMIKKMKHYATQFSS